MPTSVRWAIAGTLPVIVALSLSSEAAAQAAPAPAPSQSPPYIAASAAGESRVTPDRALVQVAVESRAESAAEAGADNRAKQERVIAAVKAAGVAAPQIRTAAYNVSPEYAQPEKGRAPRVIGYRARNTVQVEVRNIDNVGKVIDAALGAGATTIGSVGLYASSTDSARREAVRQAVTKARAEGEAAAIAAGGTLGTLIELTIDPGAVPRPLLQHVVTTSGAVVMGGDAPMAAAQWTPVEPGESLVLAVIRVRWQFVPGSR